VLGSGTGWVDGCGPGRGRCSPNPAFGGASRLPQMQLLSIAPARCISRRGDSVKFGRAPPLREMTSAAYGVKPILDCQRARRALPGCAFFATPVLS